MMFWARLSRKEKYQPQKETTRALHLSSCSRHLAPTIDRLALSMGGLLSRRGASVRLASWNVAAVNNNPFEYYTTLADPR